MTRTKYVVKSPPRDSNFLPRFAYYTVKPVPPPQNPWDGNPATLLMPDDDDIKPPGSHDGVAANQTSGESEDGSDSETGTDQEPGSGVDAGKEEDDEDQEGDTESDGEEDDEQKSENGDAAKDGDEENSRDGELYIVSRYDDAPWVNRAWTESQAPLEVIGFDYERDTEEPITPGGNEPDDLWAPLPFTTSVARREAQAKIIIEQAATSRVDGCHPRNEFTRDREYGKDVQAQAVASIDASKLDSSARRHASSHAVDSPFGEHTKGTVCGCEFLALPATRKQQHVFFERLRLAGKTVQHLLDHLPEDYHTVNLDGLDRDPFICRPRKDSTDWDTSKTVYRLDYPLGHLSVRATVNSDFNGWLEHEMGGLSVPVWLADVIAANQDGVPEARFKVALSHTDLLILQSNKRLHIHPRVAA